MSDGSVPNSFPVCPQLQPRSDVLEPTLPRTIESGTPYVHDMETRQEQGPGVTSHSSNVSAGRAAWQQPSYSPTESNSLAEAIYVRSMLRQPFQKDPSGSSRSEYDSCSSGFVVRPGIGSPSHQVGGQRRIPSLPYFPFRQYMARLRPSGGPAELDTLSRCVWDGLH